MKILIKVKTLFLVFSILICYSCNTKNASIDIRRLDSLLTELTKSDSTYVIPGTGCNSCIAKAFGFARRQKGNSRLFFIITRIQDSKLAKNLLGVNDTTINNSNIYFDKQNRLNDFGYVEIFPFLYTDGKVHYLKESDFANY